MGLVNRKQKTVNLSFEDIIDYAYNVKVKEGLSLVKEEDTKVINDSKVEERFLIGDFEFFLTDDLKVYKKNQLEYEALSLTFTVLPTFTYINHQGEPALLITDGENSYLIKEQSTQKITIPKATTITSLNGVIFAGENRKVHFLFDLEGNENNGYILLEPSVGKILKLFVLNLEVYVFCENAVVKITFSSRAEEFTIKRLDLNITGVESGSIVFLTDRVVFVCSNKICYLKNDKITVVDTPYDKKFSYKLGRAKGKNHVYELTLNKKNPSIKISYDFFNKECYLTAKPYSPYYLSKKLSFNTDALKNIEEISFYLQNDAVMILSTDTVIRRYNLKRGEKAIKPYLKCRSFKLEFLLKECEFIDKLKVKYSV